MQQLQPGIWLVLTRVVGLGITGSAVWQQYGHHFSSLLVLPLPASEVELPWMAVGLRGRHWMG